MLTLNGLITTVSGLPTPQVSGSAETATLGNLTPDTHYCVVLRTFDGDGNSAYSNVVSITAPDTTPPAQVTGVGANPGSTSATLLWNASGDDGLTGAATSYEVRWDTGAACATFTYAGAANTLPVNPGLPLPSPANNDVLQLTFATAPSATYCFAVTAADEHGNRSTPSATVSFTAAGDITPPGTLVLRAVQALDVTSTGGTLRFDAVADNGFDAASGKVAAYDIRFISVAAPPDCSALTAVSFASATSFVPQPPPVASPGQTETVALTFSGAPSAGQPFCIAAIAIDAAGNPSTPSNWLAFADNTPPQLDGTISVNAVNPHGATVQLDAPGNDGLVGQATKYLVRVAATSCASFNFATATPVTPSATPSAPPAVDSLVLTGLDYSTGYCVGVEAEDALGNDSVTIVAPFNTGAPQTTAQLAAVQQAITLATSQPIALASQLIDAVTVTYVKASVGGAALGTGDGAGFFVQDPSGTAALFVAMDPTTFARGGVSAGDRLDLTVTQGAWVGCNVCTASNSLQAITAATGTRRATGVTLPAASNGIPLTTATWPLPVTQVVWPFGASLMSTSGTISTTSTALGNGFSKFSVTTTGVASSNANLQLRVPDAVAATFRWQSGMKFILNNRPIWRTEGEADLSAWAANDIAVSPVVLSASSDGLMWAPTSSTFTLTFSQPLQPSSVTMQNATGVCSGSIQVSPDATFTNCIAGTATLDATQTIVTVTPAAALTNHTRYSLKSTGSVLGVNTLPALSFATTNGLETIPLASETCATTRQVVISQIYGGGGNSGALYKNDFIELHNRGNTTFSLTGFSVQYLSAAGTGAWAVTSLSGSIAPGGYYLVQEAAGTGGTVSLPTPDKTGTINMSGTNGRVALVSTTTALAGMATGCPSGATVVDIVGFGSPNNCQTSLLLSNTTSAQRNDNACDDTSNNLVDFNALAPAPRNSASTANLCACDGNTSVNATGQGAVNGELQFCVLQYPNPNTGYTGPIPLTAAPGATVPSLAQTGVSFIYGQMFMTGFTPSGGTNAAIIADVGVAPAGTNPFVETVFYPAAFNQSVGNNDEFQRAFPAPSATGNYGLFYRFSVDTGAHWTYCDLSGDGTNGGLNPFDFNSYLALSVQ